MLRGKFLVGVMLLFVLAACAPSEKNRDLVELEGLLQSSEGQELRNIGNAARFHQEARHYRRAAEEARLDRNDERSEEYAILGLLRYRTAVAVAAQFRAAEQLEEANLAIEEINPRLVEVNQARNELASELRDLDEAIRVAVRDREEQRRRDEVARQSSFVPAHRASEAADAALLEEINTGISRALSLRSEGQEVRAHELDRTRLIYERAQDQLENARRLLENEPAAAETVRRQVNFSVQLFEEALETAKPIYQEWVEKMRPQNRINTLRRLARNNFGAPFTEEEYNGVRIVMARLFVQREAQFQRNTEAMLNVLTELAIEYEEFSIQIYGFTQRGGGATQNLTTSQLRAHRVRDLLVQAGVDENRIDTEGFGQDQIRFTDSVDNNDRVEVIFRHTNP